MPDDTEQHRRECEAREVIKWDKERRKKYYVAIEKRRGRAAMLELWEEAKKQAKEAVK